VKAKSLEPLRSRTSRAVALLTMQSIATRAVLFASNWMLGFFLTDEAFGIIGLVNIVSTIAWSFIGFGLDEVIIQRGSKMRPWESTVSRASIAIATLTALLVAALCPGFALAFAEPRVMGPLLLIAISLPIAALSVVPAARLNASMDFKFLVRWNLIELLIGQSITVALAYFDCGAYSFILPIPLLMAIKALALNLRAPGKAGPIHLGLRLVTLIRRGGTVTGAKLANNFVGQCDYLALGLVSTTSAVGYYYFAFRLAAAPVRMIAYSLNTVLFPAIISLGKNDPRQSAAALKAAKLLSWVVSPFCYYQAAVANPILHLLFQKKWDPSIAIIQLLSIGLAIEATMAVTRAFLSATGKFSLLLRYSVLNGLGVFSACMTGAYLGAGWGVALGVSIYYVSTQPYAFSQLVDDSKQRLKNVIEIFLLPTVVSAGAFCFASLTAAYCISADNLFFQIALVTFVGWAIFISLMALAAKSALSDLTGLLRGFIFRNRKTESVGY
jgi:O-antigen/teichoic acid export membrane protein